MKLKAFELYQNGYRLFLTTIKAKDLADEKRVKTDEFDADRKTKKGINVNQLFLELTNLGNMFLVLYQLP